MKLIDENYGILSSIKDSNGCEYPKDDWRISYKNLFGIIHVYVSEKKDPGKNIIYFYPEDLDRPVPERRWLSTSVGTYQCDGNMLVCTTKNSIYTFEICHVMNDEIAENIEYGPFDSVSELMAELEK